MELSAWPCRGTRSSSRVRGALGRTASTALHLPSSCQGVVASCWHRPGCKLQSLFPWSKGKALLIIWPLSHNTFAVNGIEILPFMRLCLKAQFSLGIVLPNYYSTKASGDIPADNNGNRSKPSSLNYIHIYCIQSVIHS